MYLVWIKNVKRFLSTTVCARERSKQSDCKTSSKVLEVDSVLLHMFADMACWKFMRTIKYHW